MSAMTKAGSYLLWFDSFSVIRDYLFANMAFMIADSTGPLPRDAIKAGFDVVTYGKFYGAFLDNNGGANAAHMREYWTSQPYRPLPFFYSHSDVKGQYHLMYLTPKK